MPHFIHNSMQRSRLEQRFSCLHARRSWSRDQVKEYNFLKMTKIKEEEKTLLWVCRYYFHHYKEIKQNFLCHIISMTIQDFDFNSVESFAFNLQFCAKWNQFFLQVPSRGLVKHYEMMMIIVILLFVCFCSGPATDDKHFCDCLFPVSTINLLGPGGTLCHIFCAQLCLSNPLFFVYEIHVSQSFGQIHLMTPLFKFVQEINWHHKPIFSQFISWTVLQVFLDFQVNSIS